MNCFMSAVPISYTYMYISPHNLSMFLSVLCDSSRDSSDSDSSPFDSDSDSDSSPVFFHFDFDSDSDSEIVTRARVPAVAAVRVALFTLTFDTFCCLFSCFGR